MKNEKNQMAAPTVANATAAALLGFLHERPMTGWDLVATARLRIGEFWTVTSSQVYRELASLTKTGLVTPGPKGPRDRQPYSITQAGRAAFAAWIQKDPPEESVRFPLLLTVAFGRHLPPEKLTAILAEHRAIHLQRLAHLERKMNDQTDAVHQDPNAVACLRFGLLYEQAVLHWFEAFSAQ